MMKHKKNVESIGALEQSAEKFLVPECEQPYRIPSNWFWTTIGTINQYEGKSINPLKEPTKIFELYSVPSSADNYPEIIQGAQIGSTKQVVKKDDVLLCKINPRINRVWYVHQHTENQLLASSEWIVIRNLPMNSKYLMWCLRSEYFREYMLSNVSGVGGSLMRAQPKSVRGYPIPVSPIKEQQRIVEHIENLFIKLDEAKEKAQAVLDSFEARKASILHKAFTGEFTAMWRRENKADNTFWQTKPWGSFIEKIEAGKNWKAEGRPPHMEEFGVVKVSAVTWGEFDELESKTCTEQEQWNENVQIKQGDFLFSRANTLQLVGNCVIVESIEKRLMLTDKILRLTFDDSVDPYFVLYYTRSDLYRQQVERLASGNQESMRNISQNNMRIIEFPIPEKAEQLEIVRILTNLLSKEDNAKKAAESVLEQIDLAKKAILSRAFRGELGTNDPTEESAVELLKKLFAKS